MTALTSYGPKYLFRNFLLLNLIGGALRKSYRRFMSACFFLITFATFLRVVTIWLSYFLLPTSFKIFDSCWCLGRYPSYSSDGVFPVDLLTVLFSPWQTLSTVKSQVSSLVKLVVKASKIVRLYHSTCPLALGVATAVRE